MALYLSIGAIGLPVFADGTGGLAVLLGPTAGYLFGFLLAALVTGHLSRNWLQGRHEVTLARLALIALGAVVAVFGIGTVALGLTGMLATQGLGQTVLVTSFAIAAMSTLLWAWSKNESRAFLARFACGLIGVLIIYVPGVIALHLSTGMPIEGAIAFGGLQFIPVDLAKIFVAAGVTGAVLPPIVDRADGRTR